MLTCRTPTLFCKLSLNLETSSSLWIWNMKYAVFPENKAKQLYNLTSIMSLKRKTSLWCNPCLWGLEGSATWNIRTKQTKRRWGTANTGFFPMMLFSICNDEQTRMIQMKLKKKDVQLYAGEPHKLFSLRNRII